MNPAALKANLADLPRGADLIVNTDEFTKRNLQRSATRATRSRTARSTATRVHPIALTSMTVEALKDFDISKKDAERAKNMFALGLLSWLYHRPTEGTIAFLEKKFASRARDPARPTSPPSRRAGASARPPRTSRSPTRSSRRRCAAGRYRNITGNLALAYGLIAASAARGCRSSSARTRSRRRRDILHELSKHKRFGVRTFQAEDEIAGVGAALGAAFGGSLGVTTTSGPGLALKARRSVSPSRSSCR